ncbi:MAG: transglycosylase SLT domain-containing protein [Bacilli bacterium]|nr:transglycosylase SLT domain-containing protein [Bacilli bacterium]
MNPFNNLKENVRRYLVKNHLKSSDIKEYVPIFKNGHFYLKVTFKNGKNCNFRFFPYKLNKSGAMFLGTTIVALGATSIMGIYGAYKYSLKDNEISLNKINENEIVMNDYDESFTEPGATVSFEYVDPNDLDPYKMIESDEEYDIEKNENHRKINVKGSAFPNLASYNYVMDHYYNEIDKYGTRYGIDPAIIASLIMVECGGEKYDKASQTNTKALGLGQVNCKLFENQNFRVFNCGTGSFEDYKFKTNNLMNNHDEQIKFIAILLQYYSNRYHGDVNGMAVSYNQGMGTVDNILVKILNETNYESKLQILTAEDGSLIAQYNPYTHGDPQYFNKLMTYLKFILNKKDFGKDYAEVLSEGSIKVTYSVDTEYKIAGYNEYEINTQAR